MKLENIYIKQTELIERSHADSLQPPLDCAEDGKIQPGNVCIVRFTRVVEPLLVCGMMSRSMNHNEGCSKGPDSPDRRQFIGMDLI